MSRARLLLLLVLALACGAALALGVRALVTAEEAPRAASGPGPVDIGFAQDMSVHHDQALLMAELALGDRGARPELVAVARQILVGQAQEQGTMRGWLTLWHQPQLPAGPPMTWMSGGMGDHHEDMAMPGMATQAELDTLSRLHGRRFDERFVRLMTRHHQGGVVMAQEAARRATLPEVRSLAALMARSQLEEIATLSRLVR